MGEIIGSKPAENKIVHDVLLDEEEHSNLRGHMDNIRYFSKEHFLTETSILRRGHENGATYIRIPKVLRFSKNFMYSKIKSQRIEESSKIYFIFTLDKE